MRELLDCLPSKLRATATFTKIAAGRSGANVYRVEAQGGSYVLKIAADSEPLEIWRGRVAVQTVAAEAGLTPRLVHSDPDRRAIVSAFVEDRSFMMRFAQRRVAAVVELGELLGRVHGLPIPAATVAVETRDVLARVWPQVEHFALPAFARTAIYASSTL